MRISFFLCFICGVFTIFAEEKTDIRPHFVGGLQRFILRLNQNNRLAKIEKQAELAELLDSFYYPLRNYASCLKDSVIGNFNAVFLQNRSREFYLHLNMFEDKLREFKLSLGEAADNSENRENLPDTAEITGNGKEPSDTAEITGNEKEPSDTAETTENEKEPSDTTEQSKMKTQTSTENISEGSGFIIKTDPDKTIRKIIAETQKDLARTKRGVLLVTSYLFGSKESRKLENEALKLRFTVPSKESKKKNPMDAYKHIPMMETPAITNQNKK